ncbi:MAG: prepilin-type N-terminal cleavage/methylation domain-containing protein [Phycisphaerales bacterium]|nr:prepilin-type N-terminal cleavage/methylation domain-containing protein [Phycisphaerales bacterium]
MGTRAKSFFRARRGPGAPGFSLVELVMVVVIIGIISAIAIPRLGIISLRSAAAATQQSYILFEKSILIYRDEHDGFPPDPATPGAYMTELDGYIGQQAWDMPVPIGGRWDWIGPSKPSYSGVAVYAAGSVPAQWLPFDRIVDDGSFLSGRYKRSSNWLCRPLTGASKTRTSAVGVGVMGIE